MQLQFQREDSTQAPEIFYSCQKKKKKTGKKKNYLPSRQTLGSD